MPQQLAMFAARRPLVERFGVEFFRRVPETPGVYLMCGAGEGVLYVGKAKNLRRRLASYRSANLDDTPRKLRRLLCAVERILWDECADEAAALARERELLLALQPRFNTVGVRPGQPGWLGWQRTAGGLVLGCGELTNSWPNGQGPLRQSRMLYEALLRLFWWTLHPTLGWEQMPLQFRRAKARPVWQFAIGPQEVESLDRGLAAFFNGTSPELVEWFVGSAAFRPGFERAWIQQDALWLLECFESWPEGAEPNPESEIRDPKQVRSSKSDSVHLSLHPSHFATAQRSTLNVQRPPSHLPPRTSHLRQCPPVTV
jgi:predicted GIY-YIG superfamily endonuclease